ncbi:MAG: hypothetical protein IT289_08305, partial [Oligoflexia bacterium]|nr:hypothetical protein [Oligoflexia bacterium]
MKLYVCGIMTFLCAIAPLSAFSAEEMPQSFTYQGRLTSGGAPIADASATFVFDIMDPTSTCIIYSETQAGVALNSGIFSATVGTPVGNPARNVGVDQGHTMARVFSNDPVAMTASDVTAGSCVGGTYTPSAGNVRMMRVTVTTNLGTLTAQVLSPTQMITSVPTAIVAESLQGKAAGDFIQVTTGGGNQVTQANVETLVGRGGVTNASTLHIHDDRYVRFTPAGNQSITAGNLTMSGNFGVGTGAVPAADIEISRAASSALRITNTTNAGANTARLEFYGNTNQERARIETSDNLNQLRMSVGG